MKKFLGKMILFLLPVVLYLAAFVMLEPINYFGLSLVGASISTEPLVGMRRAMRGGIKNILLGDSRTSHFDVDYLEQVTGIRYCNQDFGGASLKEEIDLFWWTAKYNDLENVILQTSFWTMNKGYAADRIPALVPVAENPLQYLFTWDYHMRAWKHAEELLLGSRNTSYVYTAGEQAENLRYYAQEVIYPGAEHYEINFENIEALQEIAVYCRENDITFTVIFPPMDTSIWELVIEPLDLFDEMTTYKAAISEFAVVYDMEYPEMDAYTSLDYADGFHMIGMQDGIDYKASNFKQRYSALADYLDQMYNGKTEHMKIWRNGIVTE